MDYVTKRRCYKCSGDGVWEGQDPCPICLGENLVTLPEGGKPSSVIYTCPPDNVFQSHEILEAIDTTEYNNLTSTQKDGVQLLLSCGFIDLNDGKAGKVRLFAWFGGGSTTVANLTAMLV